MSRGWGNSDGDDEGNVEEGDREVDEEGLEEPVEDENSGNLVRTVKHVRRVRIVVMVRRRLLRKEAARRARWRWMRRGMVRRATLGNLARIMRRVRPVKEVKVAMMVRMARMA